MRACSVRGAAPDEGVVNSNMSEERDPTWHTLPDEGDGGSRTLEALLSRRFSCRAFLSDQVPHATIVRILELAQRTATWCNTQPWKVWVTAGASTERFRDALYRHAQGGAPSAPDIAWPSEYRGIYLERRRDAGFKLHAAVGITRSDAEGRQRQLLENYRLFGAPHMALITTDEAIGTYGVLDCGAYVSNFLLAARAFGVDSIAQAAIAHHSPFVRAHFGLPDDRIVVCGISFGYADHSHPANGFRTSRADLDGVVTWVDD